MTSPTPPPWEIAPGTLGALALAADGDETSYTGLLFRLIAKADIVNRQILARAYPAHVAMYDAWQAHEPLDGIRRARKIWEQRETPPKPLGNDLDLPFTSTTGELDMTDAVYAGGLVVMAASADSPFGRVPIVIYRFVQTDGAMLRPVVLVVDDEQLRKLPQLTRDAVHGAITSTYGEPTQGEVLSLHDGDLVLRLRPDGGAELDVATGPPDPDDEYEQGRVAYDLGAGEVDQLRRALDR